MAKIRTVLGDIAPEDAGVTLTHEHIRYAYPGCEHDHRNVWDFDTVADEVGKILELGVKDYGIKTVVDLRSAYGEPKKKLGDARQFYDLTYYNAAIGK